MLIKSGEQRAALVAALSSYQPPLKTQRMILSEVMELGCLVKHPLPHWEWDIEALDALDLDDLRELAKVLRVN